MKIRVIVMVAAVVLAVVSCKKRKYPPEQEFLMEEVFKLEATVGGTPVDLRAGTDGYYCYSSAEQGASGVYRFTSELKKFGCSDCPNSFYLQINDIKPRVAGSGVEIDSVIRPGKLAYASGGDYSRYFSFDPVFNKTASGWRWEFGDGNTSDEKSPVHLFSAPGRYHVCVKALSGSGCDNENCGLISMTENGDVLVARVHTENLGEHSARFSAIVTGNGNFSYTWYLGDGSVKTGKVIQHDYEWTGSYQVRLVVTDDQGNVAESQYNYVTGDDLSSCATNFIVDTGKVILSGLNKVKIRWTDKNNRVFSSERIVQPQESFFEIVSVEEFGPNETGDPTKLVTVRINALLSDGTDKQWFRSDNAVLAFSYK